MPRVHFVKRARKDNPAVKKGESYYWWKTRTTVGKSYFGTKHYSATYPRQSQLTSSEFLSQVYGLVEQIQDFDHGGSEPADAMENIEAFADEMAGEIESLGSEQSDKLSGMPEGLEYSPTGELLQARSDACDEMASALQGIDFTLDEGTEEEQWEQVDNALSELQSISYEGE